MAMAWHTTQLYDIIRSGGSVGNTMERSVGALYSCDVYVSVTCPYHQHRALPLPGLKLIRD